MKILFQIITLFLLNSCNVENCDDGEIKITDYKNFVGLKKGDKIQKAIELFGQPDFNYNKDSTNNFNIILYRHNSKSILEILYYKKSQLIRFIDIRRITLLGKQFDPTIVMGFFENKKINDEKIQMLGKDIELVIKLHGGKTGHFFNSYEFWCSEGINVHFVAYSDKGNTCDVITVFWNVEKE